MDSQPAMFEVASGSSNASSDSIVNISASGASSISTSPSTTNNTTNTTTTTTNPNKLQTEIEKLLEEKKILEGRLRGFKALGDLLVDCHKEKEQLRAQLSALNTSTGKMLKMPDRQASAHSPFSLVSMQAAAQQSHGDGALSHPDIGQLTLQDLRPSSPSPLSMSAHTLGPKGPPVSHPPVSGPPSSLQETVGPPGDSKETNLIHLTNTGPKPTPQPTESVPRQESLEPASGQDFLSSSSMVKINHPVPLTSENGSPEVLQLDSDKYDEATYEKVGLQLGLGHAGITGSMYAAGGSSRAQSQPTDFPSLSSETSGGMAQPPSHTSASNPPFMAMLHQSLTGSLTHRQGSDLASEVENITERLNSEPGDSMPAIALQMHQIAERISKKEQKERDHRKLIETLMAENQELKKVVKMAETSHQKAVVALREENTRLLQQLRGQHHNKEQQGLTLASSAAHGDWVHVEKPSHRGESLAVSDHSLVDRVRLLEQEKAELLRANTNWKNQWDQMEHSQQVKVADLRSQVLLGEQEVAALKARLAEQTSEFEGRMLEMKRRIGEEETMKEEAQHQQRLAERRCSELQDQLTEIRTQLSDTAREKQALAAELSVLKAHTSGQERQTSGAANASRAASRAALEAEIAMLKEQLKVFAEDFEQERIDRTTAQAARDTAKKSAETLGHQNQAFSSQIKHLQKQIKDRDDTISWTLRQNETLQRQATDYKKKLAVEWDERQKLQRRLLTLEQQLHHQQPPRNPYLSAEPSPSFTPLPMHQPPPPPARSTAAYFTGAQGGGAAGSPRHRPTAMGLSPEHLPGAWTCTNCTYINYGGRTVCETCGLVNSPRNTSEQFGYASHDMYGSEHALLMSRGGEQIPGGGMGGSGDLVVDSGQWTPAPNYQQYQKGGQHASSEHT